MAQSILDPPLHYVTKAPLEFGQYESSVGEQQHDHYVHELAHEEAPALIGIDDDRGSPIFLFLFIRYFIEREREYIYMNMLIRLTDCVIWRDFGELK